MSSLGDLDTPESKERPVIKDDPGSGEGKAAKTPKAGEETAEVMGGSNGAAGSTLHAWPSPPREEELEKEIGLAPPSVSLTSLLSF